ncbi:unnamed protein product [Rodentolepis nana]|uniref:PEHE domain-containing protein n=1 Tax=Rodentolepis nana TaxID=102285 RepID=A0A0R3TZB9_RODNA|nr:unnamed protein product [Rodentolepis nana]
MLPGSSMSRAILRTFGIDCDGDTQTQGSNALSCLSRAAHSVPGIVRRACSPPSGFLKSHVLDTERSRSYDRSKLFPDPILTSVSASQENTPPSSKRPLIRSETVVATDLPIETPIGSKRHQTVTFESHVLRPRMSVQPYGDTNNKAVKYSNLPSTPLKSVANSVHVSNSDSLSSRFIASTRPHYYQPHFDTPRESTSSASIQKLIEIPSWRVNDVISGRYAAKAGLTRVLRTRDFQRHVSRMSPKRRCPTQSDVKYEDLSDEAYHARHARLETEEIKQERLSVLRLAEDELRRRLEQRERDSWRRRQSSRLNGYLEDNPDRFMPSRLVDSVDKVQTIRVRDEVPVIAFGVKVPKPRYKSSLL